MIEVECSDGVLIEVDKELAMSMSGTIRKSIESKQPIPETDDSPIIIDNITSATLMKVLDFCSVHSAPHSVPNFKAWNEKFVRLEPSELCELASAAYYLEIRPLVDLTCKSIAKLLKGKSPAEIRKTFNILYDFSPGDDVPPPTLRDKLRSKLHFKEKGKQSISIENSKDKDKEFLINTLETEDSRSLDDLVTFIQESPSRNSSMSSSSSSSSPNSSTNSKKKKGKLKNNPKDPTGPKENNAKQTTNNNSRKLISSVSTIVPSVNQTEHISLKTSRSENVTPSAHESEYDEKKISYKINSSFENSNADFYDDDVEEDDFTSFEDDEDAIDAQMRAMEDKEVEEFRLRLESIHRNETRPKIHIPAFENIISAPSVTSSRSSH